MIHRASVVTLVFCASYAMAADNPFEKNGQPCFKEVCLGDDNFALSPIPWLEARMGLPFTWSAKERPVKHTPAKNINKVRLRTEVRSDDADLAKVALYWETKRFDPEGIAALRAIKAVCNADDMDLL